MRSSFLNLSLSLLKQPASANISLEMLNGNFSLWLPERMEPLPEGVDHQISPHTTYFLSW